MNQRRRAAKSHLELTTGSLLFRRRRWASLTGDLAKGSLLVLVPRDRSRIAACLLKIARSHARRGGDAVIHYGP